MSDYPLVSIIVPCFNVENFIEKTIEAFSNQTAKNFEVVFVDDCSTDHSFEVIEKLIDKYAIQASVVSNSQNSGPSITRQNGILSAKGEYICFCDSDDWFENDLIEVISKEIQKAESDIVFMNFYIAFDSGKKIQKKNINDNDCFNDVRNILVLGIDSLWQCVFKRTLFDNIEFPDIRNGEDMALIPLLMVRANSFSYANHYLYNYYQRSGSLSTTQTKKLVKNLEVSFGYIESTISDQYFDEIEFIGIRNVLYGALLNLFKQGNNREEAKRIIGDFEINHPIWKNNKYIGQLPLFKRLFVFFISKKMFIFARLLSKLHDLMTK